MNTFDRKFRISIILFGVVIVLILTFPYFFTRPAFFDDLDFLETGQIGDTIGGIMGPFIAIAAAALTFLAFWVQYKANLMQRKQFRKAMEKQKKEFKGQEKAWLVEQFENRFYELVKLHKANVDEMTMSNRIQGRKCFEQMYSELRCCYIRTSDYLRNHDEYIKEHYPDVNFDTIGFVYKVFFVGIGLHAQKHFAGTNPAAHLELHVYRMIAPALQEIQDSITKTFIDNPYQTKTLQDLPLSGIPDERTIEFYCPPFEGHINRLGHYYRHLFQAAKYIIEQKKEVLEGDDEKYGYIKTLRAQLSNFEQLMLYYNALAWFEPEWHDLFTTYRLIKNIPLALADFHIRPEVFYKQQMADLKKRGIQMFEQID